MELEEAASRVQGLLNFHTGLKHLAEVIDAARAAEQLKKEREAAVVKSQKDLDKARKEHDTYVAETAVLQKEMAAKLAADQAAYSTKLADLAKREKEMNDTVEKQTSTFVKEMHRRQAEAEDELNASIALLTARRDDMQRQVETVTKALSKIKAATSDL